MRRPIAKRTSFDDRAATAVTPQTESDGAEPSLGQSLIQLELLELLELRLPRLSPAKRVECGPICQAQEER